MLKPSLIGGQNFKNVALTNQKIASFRNAVTRKCISICYDKRMYLQLKECMLKANKKLLCKNGIFQDTAFFPK